MSSFCTTESEGHMPYYQNIEVNKEQKMKENFADKKEPKTKVIGIGTTGQLVTDYLVDELENVEIFSLQCDKEFLKNSNLIKNTRF